MFVFCTATVCWHTSGRRTVITNHIRKHCRQSTLQVGLCRTHLSSALWLLQVSLWYVVAPQHCVGITDGLVTLCNSVTHEVLVLYCHCVSANIWALHCRPATLHAVICCTHLSSVLWLLQVSLWYGGEIASWFFGQGPAVAALVSSYSRWMIPGLWPMVS
jgi:hypothetical protein